MLKKSLMALALVGAAASAQAATISCANTTDGRYVTVTYDDTAGTMSCGPYGSTPPPEGQAMEALGYDLLEKDDGAGDNSNGGYMDVTGLGGTSGEFELLDDVEDGVLLFKFGGGQQTPDWISFVLNGVTSGDWQLWQKVVTENCTGKGKDKVCGEPTVTWEKGGQGLSHVTLYGDPGSPPPPPPVPVPGTLGLLGLGLVGLGAVRRRKS